VLLFIIDGDIMNKKEKDLKPFTFDVIDLLKRYKEKMKENYEDYNEEEVKCPNCGWETTTLTVQAENEDEALERIFNGEGLCAECYVEMIGDMYR